MQFKIITLLLAVALLVGCEREQQDKRIPQKINCVNNLKQIGIAFSLWPRDHGGQYPFNLSTNAGGTLEFCARDKDGFDTNACLHFMVMAGEDYLRVPWLLVCPQDRTKKAATNWTNLNPENITYRLRTGTNINEATTQAIIVVCPVDGNVLYCDGTVAEKKFRP